MKEHKQRIAIAEIVGFEVKDIEYNEDNDTYRVWAETPESWSGKDVSPWLPDFIYDKNAMQQAKEKLDIHERELFRRFLRFVVTEDPNNRDNAPEFATAAQETKALLLALGKWEES
jgi:hypothetical protein